MDDSITLVINRSSVIEDTINQIQSTDGFSLHKEIKIFFVGEEAQDAGGVFKEWIFLVLKEIFRLYSKANDPADGTSFHKGNTHSFIKVRPTMNVINENDMHYESGRNQLDLQSMQSDEYLQKKKTLINDRLIKEEYKNSSEISLLLGKIVGKAIFENVPIGPRLNSFILK